MDEIWKRLEQYLGAAAPTLRDGLASGANEAEITEMETTVGYRLPSDLRQSLLRHNGQKFVDGDPAGGSLIPCGFSLLPISGMLSEWREHRSIEEDLDGDRNPEIANPGVKPFFLHAAWIPIAADIGGNSICVDLDPGEGGALGQIIEFDHDFDTPTRIASDYQSWLAKIADDLEAGKYIYTSTSRFPGFFPSEE